jgi:hypothetical protein
MGVSDPLAVSLRVWRLEVDKVGFIDDGGVLELYTVSSVDEDWPLVMSSVGLETPDGVVRKLALDRRRSSLKMAILR